MTPEKSMIVTHIFVKKLQQADWSTEEAGLEAPSKVCVWVFISSTTEQRSTTSKEVHDVEIDGVFIKPDTNHSAIGKNLRINYKINSTHDTTKTLASILVFLTILENWKPDEIPRQLEQPRVVAFLEQVICKLISTAGYE